MEELVGAAVEVVGGNNFVSHLRDGKQGKRRRGRTGCQSQCSCASLQSRHALFENIRRRIHDARVNISKFPQRKKIGGVLGAFEHVGSCLINRNSAGPGGRIRDLTRMQGEGFKVVGHKG